MKEFFALLLLCATAPFAGAQAVQDSAGVLREVVISKYHVSDSLLRTPAAIGVLTVADLQRNNNSDITPALNMIPGVLMQSGALNTSRISIRGIGARTPYGTNKIRAFYGSIPLTSGDSETTIEDIDPQIMGQVEVIRGPMSSVYGAGLGGAIIISPKMYTASGGRAFLSTTHGSFGLTKSTATFGFSGNNSSINLGYHRLDSDGHRENSRYHREGVTLAGDLFRKEKSRLTYFGSYTYMMAHIASSIDKATFETTPSAAAPTWKAAQGYEQYHSWLGGLAYDVRLAKNLENATSVFLNYKDSYEPRPFDILFQKTTGYGVRTQFTGSTIIGTIKTRFLAGAEVFTDGFTGGTAENLYQQNNNVGSLEGAQLTANRQRRQFVNAFAQAKLHFTPNFALHAGLNYNKTAFRLETDFPADEVYNERYSYNGIWAPQAALLYEPTKLQTLYVSASRGFSLPAIEETLTPQGTINPHIKPETGYNIEAGGKAWFFNRSFYAEVAVYRMIVSNLLVAQRVGNDQYVGVNAGSTQHEGVEAALKYDWATTGNLSLHPYLNASVGRYRFREFNNNGTDYSGNALTGVPAGKVTTGITMRGYGAYLNADYYFVDKLPINDANTVYADAYRLLNLKAGYSRELVKGFLIDASFGINNATNTRYAAMVLVNATATGSNLPRYYYPGQPVNYYANFSLFWYF